VRRKADRLRRWDEHTCAMLARSETYRGHNIEPLLPHRGSIR
jgi:hypothetical protein